MLDCVSFLAQSVFDMKARLKAHGSDLGVYFGRPESIVPSLVRHLESMGDKVEGVWLQREVRMFQPPLTIAVLTKHFSLHLKSALLKND